MQTKAVIQLVNRETKEVTIRVDSLKVLSRLREFQEFNIEFHSLVPDIVLEVQDVHVKSSSTSPE